MNHGQEIDQLIAELRADATLLRTKADALDDQEHAKYLREIAEELDGVASDAERGAAYTSWLAEGAPLDA